MILTRMSNLSCTLLTCCGAAVVIEAWLKRALRRMRRSCLHQLVLRLLEVDPSTTNHGRVLRTPRGCSGSCRWSRSARRYRDRYLYPLAAETEDLLENRNVHCRVEMQT